MKPKNSGSGRRIVCLVLVAVMLLGLISSALIIMVNAASSSEIKKELNGLRSQQAELKKGKDQGKPVQDPDARRKEIRYRPADQHDAGFHR